MLLLGMVLVVTVPSARADDVLKDSALAQVPADTAFFSAYLRNKEQVDRLRNSKAFQALMKLPAVQLGLQQLKTQLDKEGGPMEAYRKFIEDEDNKALVDLLIGAASDEVFVWGGASCSDLLETIEKAYGAMRLGPMEAVMGGALNPFKGLFRNALLELQKNRAKLRAPEIIVGFKVKEPRKIEAQIKRFEKPLARLIDSVDPLKGKLKREGSFLTVQVSGAMIPWDDINFAEIEDQKGEFDELVKHLKKTTLTVSLGVQGDYLLLAVTSIFKDLERFAGKGKNLASRDELKPLGSHAARKVTTVHYTSKAYRQAWFKMNNHFLGMAFTPEMAAAAKRMLEATRLDAKRKKVMARDIDAFADELQKRRPVFGDDVSFTFLTGSGYEGYSHDLSNFDHLKGVKVKLAEHLGGDPLFTAAFGSRLDPTLYPWMAKWTRKGYEHAETLIEELADDEMKKEFQKFTRVFGPLFKKLDETTTKLLLPSVQETGLGIVVDARWSSKQWRKEMPKTEQALPMLEVGLLVGINDPKRFASAMTAYRMTINELNEKAGAPDTFNLPEFKIPAPDTKKGKNGTLFSWAIPEESGLDRQFQPTAGVGKDVSVLTLSAKHTERLLTPTPLTIKDVPLDAKEDLVGVGVLNGPALIDAALPWVEFAIRSTIIAKGGDDKDEKVARKMADAFIKQAREAATILKCFKGASSVSYLEDGRLITHTRIILRDLADKTAPPKED